jgi:hypothetical protein
MAIKIVGRGVALSNTPNDPLYTAPGDVISATIATGTVENKLNIGAKLFLYISGRNTWVIHNRDIPVIGAPLILPAITLNAGETLQAWCDTPGALDINVTIGEQR